MHTSFITILALSLSLICLGCLDPPGGGGAGLTSDNTESSNTESSNGESNGTSLSLSEFLNKVSHRVCEYYDKCELFISGDATTNDCVAETQAEYNAWLASDCGPGMESYYSANIGDLEHCPDYIANQECDSDDFGYCPALELLTGNCQISSF